MKLVSVSLLEIIGIFIKDESLFCPLLMPYIIHHQKEKAIDYFNMTLTFSLLILF